MKLTIKVMSVATDTRQFVGTKTGANRNVKITNVLGQLEDGEFLNCRCFNDCELPVVGKPFTFDLRRYEKKGMVADVIF